MGRLPILLTSYASLCAREDAQRVIEYVRSANEPIVWLTDNRYMPPLRQIGRAEKFYSGSFWNPSDSWTIYVETFVDTLERADIFHDCPVDDNALYAVDLKRFEYVEDEDADADDLSDEWRPIT